MRDLAYRALTAKEALGRELQREPTVDEVARRLDVKREDVVLALDSIQDPVSLFDPVFNDDGDPICVMDQIRDMKNTDARWIENLSLSEEMCIRDRCSPYLFIRSHTSLLFPSLLIRANARARKSHNKNKHKCGNRRTVMYVRIYYNGGFFNGQVYLR